MRRSPLESYELLGRMLGISALSAGGPGFRHVPIRGILTGRLWFSPAKQMSEYYLEMFMFIYSLIYLFIYYVS